MPLLGEDTDNAPQNAGRRVGPFLAEAAKEDAVFTGPGPDKPIYVCSSRSNSVHYQNSYSSWVYADVVVGKGRGAKGTGRTTMRRGGDGEER